LPDVLLTLTDTEGFAGSIVKAEGTASAEPATRPKCISDAGMPAPATMKAAAAVNSTFPGTFHVTS
jgi:hypothetical protein